MLNQLQHTGTLVLSFYLTFLLSPAIASEISSTTSVFEMTRSQAEQDNATSQYKLAAMYELGIGIEKNPGSAIEWYQKALDNGIMQAEDRLIYMDISQNGYNAASHAAWVKRIRIAAGNKDQDALLLLGQMYSHGAGVPKNLSTARTLLSEVDMLINPFVAYEIERVSTAISQDSARRSAERDRQRKSEQKQATQTVRRQAEDKREQDQAAIQAEKRRRYEEVMRQLAEEQRILEQTQAWAEGRGEMPDNMAVK